MAYGAGTAPWRGMIVASNPRTIATFSPYSESDDSEDEGEGQAQQVQHVRAGRLPPTKPLYRTNRQDIAPATVICVARFSRPACLFPPKTAQVPVPTKTIHVYAILIENGFKTFAQQRFNASAGNMTAQSALFYPGSCLARRSAIACAGRHPG